MNKLVFRLKQNKLFENADEQKLKRVLESDGCAVCKYRPGEQIDVCDKIAFVLSGSVCVFSDDDKRRLLLRKIEKDEVFGVAGLFVAGNKLSKCFAKGNCEILSVDSESVRWLLENDKEIMYNYISFLSGKVSYLNKKITYLTAGSAERKLAVYLSSFETDEINLGVSLSSIADMLDIGRASLYRALDRFASDGCIKRDGNSITILNKAFMLENY